MPDYPNNQNRPAGFKEEKEYLQAISIAQDIIDQEKKRFQKLVAKVKDADKAYRIAVKNYENRPKPKTESKLRETKRELEIAIGDYKKAKATIQKYIVDVRNESDALARYYYSERKYRLERKEQKQNCYIFFSKTIAF